MLVSSLLIFKMKAIKIAINLLTNFVFGISPGSSFAGEAETAEVVFDDDGDSDFDVEATDPFAKALAITICFFLLLPISAYLSTACNEGNTISK